MPHSPRKLSGMNVTETFRGLAVLIRNAEIGPRPAYLRMGIPAIIGQLKLGIPGLVVPPRQPRADDLSRRAVKYTLAGQFPRAMSLIMRALADAPYDSRLWHQWAVLWWDTWPNEDTWLCVDLLEFALWINPNHIEARSDLLDITAFLESAGDEADKDDPWNDIDDE